MDTRPKGSGHRFRAAGAFVVWTVISVLHLYVTRELLARFFVSEVLLTFIQTLLSAIYGIILLRFVRGADSLRKLFRKKLLVKLLPVAAVAVFRDVSKFGGLARISVNLTVTIRSLSPVASVVLQKLFWGEDFPLETVITLIPIVGGVSLASAGDLLEASAASMERLQDVQSEPALHSLLGQGLVDLSRFLVGCLSCIFSVFLGVGHSMLTKRQFAGAQDRLDPLSMQIAQSVLSLAFLAPYFGLRFFVGCFGVSRGKNTFVQILTGRAVRLFQECTASGSRFRASKMVLQSLVGASGDPEIIQRRKSLFCMLALKGLVNFVQSLFSLISLNELNNVSFTIASSMRRMISGMITVVLFYRASVSSYGILGIAMSIAGCVLYERTSSLGHRNPWGKTLKWERDTHERAPERSSRVCETHQVSISDKSLP